MRKMNIAIRFLIIFFILLFPHASTAFQIEKSAIYVYLHEVKPVEEEADEALEEKDYAKALGKYREALRGYEDIWKQYPDLANERPRGTDRLVDESAKKCREIIGEIKERGEAQDEFYQKLNAPVRANFSNEHIRSVARALTFLTDVNIIVDETVFDASNRTLNPAVTIKTDEPWTLRTIISHLCSQSGLAFSIEADHVFISTRVKLDQVK